MKKINTVIIILFIIGPLMAGQISDGQRETGEIVLNSLSVKDGILSFGTETGGCTTKKSFRINIGTVKDIAGKAKNYTLTIIRIVPDECKAFLPQGIFLEYDLEKDLGLKGYYTISVINMILPRK